MGFLMLSWCGVGLADRQLGFGMGQTGACMQLRSSQTNISNTNLHPTPSSGRPGPQPSNKSADYLGGGG